MKFTSASRPWRINSTRLFQSAPPLLAAAVCVALTSSADAAAKTWIGPDGAVWVTSAAWSPTGVPINLDDVSLGTSPASGSITLNYNFSYFSTGLNSLTINPTGISGNFTFSQTLAGTAMFATNETIGSTTTRAVYNQSTGNNTVTNLILGSLAGSFGTYTFSDGNITATNENIGSLGNGNFSQTGGTNAIGPNGSLAILGSGTSSYSLSNGNITLTSADLLVGANALSTFNQLSGNVTFSSSQNSFLELGAHTGGTGNYTLTSGVLSGAAEESIGTSGTGNFTQNGGANFIPTSSLVVGENGLAGSFNSVGTYNLNGGVLTAGSEVIGSSGTGTFLQNGGSNFTSNLTLAATSNGVGNYALTAGTLTTGAITINPGGTFTQTGGSLSYSTFTLGGGIFVGTLQNQNAFIYNTGTFSGRLINNGTVTLDADFSPTDGILNNSNFTIPLGRIVSVDGAGLDNESQFTITNATLTGAGPITNNATFTAVGTLSGSGGFTNNLAFIQGAGNLLFSNTGSNTNLGTITLASGRQFQLASGSTIINNGSFLLNSAAVTGPGTLSNSGGGVITGPGLITSSFTNSAILQPGSGTLNITSPWSNSGIIQLTSTSSTLIGGAITNSNFLQGQGAVSANVTNNATIESLNGTLIFSASLTNNGTLSVPANSQILVTGSFPTNAGTISLTGGAFENSNQPLANTGQITGYGTLATGTLTNNNAITFTGGATTINSAVINSVGKTIVAKNDPAIFTGSVTNNGTILVTNTTVTFTGPYTGNAYISDPSTNIFQSTVTIIPSGSMSGGPTDAFIFTGPSFSNSGNFSNSGSLTVSAAITNAATFTQTGPQSWSPTSSFSNTAGLATFGSNAKLYGLSITAGTVDITTTKFIIETTAPTKSATLAALQKNIANGSLLAGNLPPHTALALIDNATLPIPFTTFGGMPADSNSLLLAPELLGDSNIDGHVDLTDLNTVLNHLGTANPFWTAGNFDGQPTIDLTDLNDVLNNLGTTFPNPATQLPMTNYQLPTAPAPEPASLSILALNAAIFLGRRKKNRPPA